MSRNKSDCSGKPCPTNPRNTGILRVRADPTDPKKIQEGLSEES